MWRAALVWRVSQRCPCRLYTTKSPKAPKATRTQAEKQKRRREKEKAILSSQSPKDEALNWSEKEKIQYTAQTPPGEKKDTSLPFPAAYSPDYVEPSWYQWWEKEEFFRPEQHDSLPHATERTFSMCIPPPNVTGTLHLGHALTVAVEDALVRWRRMQGHRVLWLPGCDHAGIATQTVVERRLLRDSGRRRQDMSRDEFLQAVWKWKNEKGEEIYRQLRRMGASLDWSRACFTMDPGFSRAVTEAFVRLCDSGLIYRSEALINWSCALQSAISDIEVDFKELSGRTMLSVPGYERPVEFGTMLTFAYPIEGHDGEVAVSTTRLETMLGDVAIAVHPEDPRYQAVHGKQCRHPFTGELLPIITDSMVDMQLGTGAVKVTPAHDHTDFLLSQRHSLPHFTVIGDDGTMTPPCGDWLKGVKRFDARQMIVDALVEKRLFRGTREHSMALPVCSRSGDIIEPLLKKQWFVRCKGMAAKAIQAVEDGELEIFPQFYSKTWKNWLSNISDWCVSRQLWWGHQIPAYRVELPDNVNHKEELWVWGRSEEEARQRASVKYGVPPERITLTRDPDVLDTWFSSGLFPFAMLGWPQPTKDMERFYPNSVLETGSDLIFFWVARMVMLGTELTGQLPFKQVLLHSLVRDKHGRKMSKSLGNVVDPVDVIHGTSLEKLQEKVRAGNLDPREQLVAMEAQSKDFPKGIPQCGTDALRFALCSHKTQGEDVNLSLSHILSCRHFCNKMWQTVRFTLGVLDSGATVEPLEKVGPLGGMERWVLSRLYSTVLQCEQSFEAYELHSVTSALHTFWVNSLCDVYMEYMKPLLSPQTRATEGAVACSVLFHCVSVSLALLNPFMPFITEELWQRLQPHQPPATARASLCLQPYPSSQSLARWHFPDEERDVLWVQEVVRVTRSLRAQSGVTKEKPTMWVECSPTQAKILQDFSPALQTLSRVSTVQLVCPVPAGDMPQLTPSSGPPKDCVAAVVDHTCRVHLNVKSGVNVDRQIAELTQRRDRLVPKLEQYLARVRSKDYQTKAPSHVREELDKKVWALQQELQNMEEQLQQMTALREEHSEQ